MRLMTWTLSAVRWSPTSAPGIVSMMRNDFVSGEPSGLSVPRRISMAGVSARRSPAVVLGGMEKVSCTASPICCAARSLTATGMGGDGGVGSPGAPQPLASNRMKRGKRISKYEIDCRRRILNASGFREFRVSIFEFRILQDVPAEILVLDDIGELLVYVGGIDFNVFLLEVGRLEGEFVENLFKDSVKPAGADVFRLLIDAGSEFRDSVDSIVGDVELDAFGFEQRDILLDERILGLGENAHEVLFLQGLQLNADGQATLQLGNQVRRFADVKGAGGDE